MTAELLDISNVIVKYTEYQREAKVQENDINSMRVSPSVGPMINTLCHVSKIKLLQFKKKIF